MNKNNIYYHEKISRIPAQNVRTMVETELRDLMFDCGKSVAVTDPDFKYMVDRVSNTLSALYPEWEMMYLDTCLKNGMLDEYDKGQTITVKRLLNWLAAFQRSLRGSLQAERENKSEFSDFDLKKFADNGARFPQIILFRIQRKPEYDADEWTLEKIEQTAAFQSWKKRVHHDTNVHTNIRRAL